MNKILLRRIRIISRAPSFFIKKLYLKIMGIERFWIKGSRENFLPGSWRWLALTESLYGGFQVGFATGACRGGDRMSPFFHGYGETYEEFLKPWLLLREQPLTLVEVGILNGSGLAIWCDLFPKARVIGLDLNLSNFHANRSRLESYGAFSNNAPEVYEFNQLDPSHASSVLKNVLGDSKIDIAVDDGCHSIESIKITFNCLRSFLKEQFVYFIEDNFDTYDVLASEHKDYRWSQRGEMVIVRNR
jgi:hypothetical protein